MRWPRRGKSRKTMRGRKIRSGRPRGGARPGAGRKNGDLDKKTLNKIAAITVLAKRHTEEALNTIVYHMRNKRKEPGISERASEYLLNRVYGVPKQAVKLGFVTEDAEGNENEEIEFTMKFTRKGDK